MLLEQKCWGSVYDFSTLWAGESCRSVTQVSQDESHAHRFSGYVFLTIFFEYILNHFITLLILSIC